jgi:hypothetical protein
MESWLAKLERRFGKFAPHNLILWIVGLSGLVYLLSYTSPAVLDMLVLDPEAVGRGEVWRLVTFLFLPWGGGSGPLGAILTIFALMFLYTVGSSLEAEWGSFKFDLYYLVGVVATIIAALLFGPVTNAFLNLSLLLAFATVFPDYEILLIILPMKMKWLGLFDAAWMLYALATGTANIRAGILAALLNWFLFCGGPLLARMRGQAAVTSRRKRFAGSFSPAPERRPRVCAKCGRSDKDDPNLEFRVCDCQEKCHGQLTEYCIQHARAH